MSVSCQAVIDGFVVFEETVAAGLVPVGLREDIIGDSGEPFCPFGVFPDRGGTLGVEVAEQMKIAKRG